MPTITLIGKPGCHLCDDARAVITTVMAEVNARPGAQAAVLEEVSILDDPVLAERHADDIPVVLIDGTMHTYWRVDPVRLADALAPKKSRRFWKRG